MKLSLSGKVGVAVVAAALLAGIGALLSALVVLDHEGHVQAHAAIDRNMRVAWNEIRKQGTVFSQEGDMLLADGKPLNGRNDIVDNISGMVGGTATIFMGDTRVATSVRAQDGSRAVGTRLARNEAYASVFERHVPFRGMVDILGTSYITGYDPILDEKGTVIGILYVGMKSAEFFSTVWTVILWIVLVTLLSSLVGIFLALSFTRRQVTQPLLSLVGTMGHLSRGQTDMAVPYQGRSDEIGEIAAAIQSWREASIKRREQADEIARQQQAAHERVARIDALTRQFESSMQDTVKTVSQAASRLETTASAMSGVAERTAQQASSVVSAAEQSSQNVNTVAAATEELTASIKEIARRVEESNAVVRQAATQAANADNLVRGLAAAASRIGEVVSLINDIAAQTNLLALNATIEAARAGDAGKGFAVVAGEVKNLATQTAKATQDIAQQVGAVQAATDDAVREIEGIAKIMESVSEISTSIATSVEEQQAATGEIAKNVTEAARSSADVSSNISGVDQGARETGDASRSVLESARTLGSESTSLGQRVTEFISQVKAG